VFHQQAAIYESGDLAGGLIKIAAKFGLSRDQVAACTSDEKAIAALNDRVNKASQDGVDSTPTFLIGATSVETSKPMAEFAGGATRLEGEKPLADFAAVLDPMLAK
jgi:predicted DsbA family dithiol-disulfide isomerase